MEIKKEPDDNPVEGDIWFKENDNMYRYTNGHWVMVVDLSNDSVNVPGADYPGVPQKTSETHVVIPLLCLGILVSLTALMLLLMIL